MGVSQQPRQPLSQRLLDALPQTQCTRCGYPDCAAYAASIAGGQAAINQCPPGGAEGVRRLAAVLQRPDLATLPLNPANGTEGPRALAVIDEAWCIGCTLCLPVCPTDAILGSNKQMHTVIEVHCTGCELCLPVCPVDCIRMEPAHATGGRTPTGWAAWSQPQADAARSRYKQHSIVLSSKNGKRSEEHVKHLQELATAPGVLEAQSRITDEAALAQKKAIVQAALDRARARQMP
ncbi:MAG: electron transport complex subunit RsxB [Pseudomonadota bacterium]|jgi:electron transport complex protein RnfB